MWALIGRGPARRRAVRPGGAAVPAAARAAQRPGGGRAVRLHRGVTVAVLSIVAGLAVAVFPLAAGNGMEALRSAPGNATVGLALALAVGKLVGHDGHAGNRRAGRRGDARRWRSPAASDCSPCSASARSG